MSQKLDDRTDYCNLATDPPQPWPTFSPPGCWSVLELAIRRSASRFVPRAWLPATIESTPALVDIPSRVADASEFRTLHYYQAHIRPAVAATALYQASSAFGLAREIAQPLLSMLRVKDAEFEEKVVSALTIAKADASAIVMQQKLLFNRARPWQIDQSITSLIFPLPAHPSYPSAHATQSYACALLLGALARASKGARTTLLDVPSMALALATGVAVNREYAGVHYPSDSFAGLQLANRIVQHCVADAGYRRDIFDPLVATLDKLL